jgi:predicted DNA-binding transcriptional regulator AlpA
MSHIRKIISPKVTRDRAHKSRVQLWRDVKAGRFPAPVEVGPNAIGWFEDEVAAWQQNLPRRTYGATAPTSEPNATDQGNAA